MAKIIDLQELYSELIKMMIEVFLKQNVPFF